MLIVYKSGHYFRIIHYNMMYLVAFQILFEFTTGEGTVNFAIDDVTLTQGTCGNK